MSEPARKEVSPHQGGEIVQANDSLLDAILRIANDASVDLDRFERLVSMHERLSAQRAKAAFTQALAELQPQLPVIDEKGGIKNNSGVVQSTYATYEDINDAIRPLLARAGFTLSFRPGVAPDGKVTVTGVLRHRDGHEDEATITLPHDPSDNKNTVQAVGSSLSYGKRYAVIALLNITSRARADRDDDGHGAGLSEVAQRAITEINMADDLDTLRKWKNEKFDGVMKMVSQEEGREIVALYNRRSKAFRSAQSGAGQQTAGDR